MAKSLPYMPFYPSQFLAHTQHLTAEEVGIYIRLLAFYWEIGKPLKNSDKILASAARISEKKWKKFRKTMEEFFIVTETSWIHDRVDADRNRILQKTEKNSRSGRAQSKEGKEVNTNENTGLPENPQVEVDVDVRVQSDDEYAYGTEDVQPPYVYTPPLLREEKSIQEENRVYEVYKSIEEEGQDASLSISPALGSGFVFSKDKSKNGKGVPAASSNEEWYPLAVQVLRLKYPKDTNLARLGPGHKADIEAFLSSRLNDFPASYWSHLIEWIAKGPNSFYRDKPIRTCGSVTSFLEYIYGNLESIEDEWLLSREGQLVQEQYLPVYSE
jgi:uncharacterized protein YdaU (DUF1376 family)